MLGYSKTDINEILEVLAKISDQVINTAHPDYAKVKNGLSNASNLLEGLLIEGYFA